MSETELTNESTNHNNLNKSKEDIFSSQMNSPIWERKFVQMIENMKTIPYVSLMHFKFIDIEWNSDFKDENLKKKSFESLNINQVNHWDLVKRIMFLKATKNSFNLNKKSLNKKSKTNSSLELDKRKLKNKSLRKNNLIVNKLENMFSYLFFKKENLKKNKKLNKIKGSNKENLDKRKKQLKKKSLDDKKTNSSSHQNIGLKKNFEKDYKDEHSKKDQSCVDTEKKSLNKNFLNSSKKQKNLLDLDDLSKRRKLQKLSFIMSKDEGPFMINYRTLLGIEFWSNYCGVEKWQLLAACSNILLEEPKTKLSSTKTNTEKEKKKTKKIFSLFIELKQFIKGKDEPVKAPQRVISPEEKLRLVSYKRLLNPNRDLKKTFHSNTVQDQFKKKLKKLYTSIVYLIGGNYPLKRRVDIEEVYEDILLWVLDTYQAKTRFIALLNDQIKLEII